MSNAICLQFFSKKPLGQENFEHVPPVCVHVVWVPSTTMDYCSRAVLCCTKQERKLPWGSLHHTDWFSTKLTSVFYVQHSHHIFAWAPPNKHHWKPHSANQGCEEYLHSWIQLYQQWLLKERDSLYKITGICIHKCHLTQDYKTKLLFLWDVFSFKVHWWKELCVSAWC